MLCLLALCGCGNSAPAPSASAGPSGSAVPFPVDRAACSISRTHTGVETYARSSTAMEAGTDLYLPLYLEGMQWAVYQVATGPLPLQASVKIDPASTSEFWVGLADFTAQTWVLSGPYSADCQLPVVPAVNRSLSGNLYITLIVMAGEHAQITKVAVLDRQPPVAKIDFNGFSYTNKLVPRGQQYFDAADSYARDGELVKYEWDLDGDGTYETEQVTPDSVTVVGANPAGRFMLRLRVTDDADFTATDEMPITSTVGYVAGVGQPADLNSPDLIAGLAMVEGRPAICWEENRFAANSQWRLKYARSTSSERFTLPSTVKVISASDLNSGAPAFAVINGKPAAVYSEYLWGGASQLWYVQAEDADGTSWQTTQVAAATWDEGSLYSLGEHSLAEIDGHPALLYGLGQSDHKPFYVRSSDADGAVWPAGTSLHPYGVDWRVNYLFPYKGRPLAVCQSDFFFAQDPQGINWDPVVHTLGIPGWAVIAPNSDSLQCVVVHSLDSWYEDYASSSTFLRSDSSGRDWSGAQLLDDGPQYNSCFVIIDGRPWFFWTGGNKLYCCKALDPAGDTWASVELVDVTERSFPYEMQVAAIDTGHSAGVAWTSNDSFDFRSRSVLYYDELPY